MWLDADTALRHLDRLHAAALALCGGQAYATILTTTATGAHITIHNPGPEDAS